jgi:hypothetical protein
MRLSAALPRAGSRTSFPGPRPRPSATGGSCRGPAGAVPHQWVRRPASLWRAARQAPAPASSHRSGDKTCLPGLLLARRAGNNVQLTPPSSHSSLLLREHHSRAIGIHMHLFMFALSHARSAARVTTRRLAQAPPCVRWVGHPAVSALDCAGEAPAGPLWRPCGSRRTRWQRKFSEPRDDRFSPTAQPLSYFQNTERFELTFRALQNSDGTRALRFERANASQQN